MTSVVLISQLKLLREGLQRLLEASEDVELLGAYGEVEDALPEVRARRPDVILLHWRALAAAGPPPLRLLAQEFPKLPVVLLLNRAQRSDVEAAQRRGAAGCLDLRVDASYLADALRLAATGQFVAGPYVTNTG